ncbi:MAG: DUF6485 family protein [Planctomycetota bacterium]
MAECRNHETNLRDCGCTYPGCSRKGYCCECIAYHRAAGEIPGCLFPPAAEQTFDRSAAAYARATGRS